MRQTTVSWLCGITVLVVVWGVASAGIKDSNRFPGPWLVLSSIANNASDYIKLVHQTGMLALGGLCVAAVGALVLVVATALLPQLEPFFYPYIIMLKASPAVAFGPLLAALFPTGDTAKVVVSAMIAFFPMVIGGLDGIRRTPDRLELLVDSYGVGPLAELCALKWAYGLSGFLSGMKTAAPLSVVGAIVGEFVHPTEAGHGGIGVYIASHARGIYMTEVYAGVLSSTFLGLTTFLVASLLAATAERYLHLER